jgi:hypothetical protein
VFPAGGVPRLKLDPLPIDKDALEREIVERFLVAYERIEGEANKYVGKAPEPGDAVIAGESGEEIYIQLGEVVDRNRIQTTERRSDYGRTLWQTYPELQDAYAGVQIAIVDVGDAFDLQTVDSPEGQIALSELAREIKSLLPIVQSLPDNAPGELKGKETWIRIAATTHPLTIRLLRYAKAESGSPVKWLWTGSHMIREPGLDLGFTEVLRKKMSRYGRISVPFWLVLYSIDCDCDETEQAALLDQLGEKPHPFDKIFLFFPATGERIKLLHQKSTGEVPSEPQPRQRILARLLPEDAIPKWDDPRWRSPS